MGGHAPEPLPVEFKRLLELGYKKDPLCRRKIAIAKRLLEQELWETDVFVPGVRYVQKEPAFGGPVDTAPELRAICGIAFAQLGRSDALDVLAELLADPEPVARLGAGRGLGDAGRPDATALLRYKILLGDKEPEVIATCLESLLHLGDAFEFCLQLLAAHDDRAEATALALAGRRDPRAFEPIRAWGDSALAEQRRRVAYVALALLRADAATEHLLDVVRSGEQADAFAAAKALAIFKDDPAVVAKLRAAVPAKLRAQLDDLLGR